MVGTLAGCQGGARPAETPRVASAPTLLRTAREALEKGDLEQAQSDYARSRAEWPQSAEASFGFGESSFRLFQACAADPKRGNALLYLQDAEAGFRSSYQADPTFLPAYLGASRVAREKGDGSAAGKHAQGARDHVTKDTPPETTYAVLLELGRARALEYLQAFRQSANPVLQGELYQRAKDAFGSASALFPERAEPVIEFANVDASRGAVGDALDTLAGAIAARPEEVAYHQALTQTALRTGMLPRLAEIYAVRLAKLEERSATVLWYAGYVRTREAEAARLAQDTDGALRTYGEADSLFAKSAERNASFAASVRASRALVLAGEARALFERRKIGEAAEKLTAAFALDAGIAEQADGLGVTPKRTSLEIGGEYFKEGDLAAGAQCFENWLAFSKDDVDWLNNAGLMERDLGEELARRGEAARAKECFERSYERYRRAAELRPDEPRLVNDAALILLYHLDRDLDVAEAMFRRAIGLGEDRLEDLGEERPEVDDEDAATQLAADRWDYIAEATGDAYQNLALLLWTKQADAAEIRRLLERSFRLDPRGTRGHLKEDAAALPASGPAPKRDRPLR